MEVGVITDSIGEHFCLSFYDLTTGVRLKSYKNGACGKNGIAFIGNDYILCAQYKKQLIHVYDAVKEQLVKKIVCPEKITALTISPDGNYCVVALLEKIYIWQICTGNLMNILSKHYQTVTSIKFTSDGSFFITSGDDNLVLIWKFVNVLQPKDPLSNTNICEQPLHTLSHHSMPIEAVHVGIGGMRCHIATCSLDQTCKLYNLMSGQMLCSLVFDVACSSVTMDTMETRLFAGTTDGKIFIVNCFAQKPSIDNHIAVDDTPFIKAHSKEVVSLSVSMDNTKLLSGSTDGIAKLWHISSRQCLKNFTLKGAITNAAILPYPTFINDSSNTYTAKIKVQNFKRSIYAMGGKTPNWNTLDEDDEDLVPIVLKTISCEEENTSRESDLLEQALAECSAYNHDSQNSLKTASRVELIERINTLESMAKEFYKFSSEKLINKIENEEKIEVMNFEIHDGNNMENG